MSKKERFVQENTHAVEFSLVRAYDALGLIHAPQVISPDTSIEAITQKIAVPGIAQALGASDETVERVHGAALTAHLLDSYSETGDRSFLAQADTVYTKILASVPVEHKKLVLDLSRSALSYFYFEAAVARRIAHREQFLDEEAIEYLLRRGADSMIFAALLQIDGITFPGLISGFRARQALKDLRDDVEDLEQDRATIGANVLLLATRGNRSTIREFADRLLYQTTFLEIPAALKNSIENEYELAIAALN